MNSFVIATRSAALHTCAHTGITNSSFPFRIQRVPQTDSLAQRLKWAKDEGWYTYLTRLLFYLASQANTTDCVIWLLIFYNFIIICLFQATWLLEQLSIAEVIQMQDS